MELEKLQGLIVSLIIIGLLLGVGFLLIREFADTMGDVLYDGSALNESMNFPSGRGLYVTRNHTNYNCFHSFVVTKIFNGTGWTNVTIEPGNYSYEPTTGRVWNITPLPSALCNDWSTGTWDVNYQFYYSNSTACAGMEETVEATEKIQEWLGIIAVMFLVGILLFIVYKFAFPSMGGGKIGEGGGKFKFKGFGGLGGGGGDSGTAEI